jgi:Fe-S cluster biogenesis protein NfuA/nitrite reductase/ring-hydroxylating ferredoxin subunit
MAERRAEATTNRVESLLREVGVQPSVERAADKAEELTRALVEFYGDGLAKVLEIVHDAAGDRSEAIFDALCADRYVESLLALHDLHPLSLEDRVRAALDGVRPYLESHEGDIELDRVEGNVAYVVMGGSCDGCPSSAATLKHGIEKAIFERVPEIDEVRAVGVEPSAQPLQTSSLRLETDWVALGDIWALASSGVAHVSMSSTPVLLAQRDDTVYAYRDRCPACTHAFDDARLDWPQLCCSCGERYDLVRAGRSEKDQSLFAEPFPLVRDGDRIRVAIPIGV